MGKTEEGKSVYVYIYIYIYIGRVGKTEEGKSVCVYREKLKEIDNKVIQAEGEIY